MPDENALSCRGSRSSHQGRLHMRSASRLSASRRTIVKRWPTDVVFAFFTTPANDLRGRPHVKENDGSVAPRVGSRVRQVVAGRPGWPGDRGGHRGDGLHGAEPVRVPGREGACAASGGVPLHEQRGGHHRGDHRALGGPLGPQGARHVHIGAKGDVRGDSGSGQGQGRDRVRPEEPCRYGAELSPGVSPTRFAERSRARCGDGWWFSRLTWRGRGTPRGSGSLLAEPLGGLR